MALKLKTKMKINDAPVVDANEVIAFDRGGAFEPGEYELKPIQPIVRFGNPARKKYMQEYAKRSPKKRHPQKGNRAKPHVVSGVRERMSTLGE